MHPCIDDVPPNPRERARHRPFERADFNGDVLVLFLAASIEKFPRQSSNASRAATHASRGLGGTSSMQGCIDARPGAWTQFLRPFPSKASRRGRRRGAMAQTAPAARRLRALLSGSNEEQEALNRRAAKRRLRALASPRGDCSSSYGSSPWSTRNFDPRIVVDCTCRPSTRPSQAALHQLALTRSGRAQTLRHSRVQTGSA